MTGYRSQPVSKQPHYSRVRLIFSAGLIAVFLGLLAQLAYLTILRGEEYSQRATANLLSFNRLSPPRGSIFDAEGRTLATSRRTYSLAYSPYRTSDSDARATLERLQSILPEDIAIDIPAILSTRPRWTIHSIARRLPPDSVLAILERPSEFPGVRIADDFEREYHFPLEMAPILGHLSRIVAEDGDRYERPRYLPDDMVGRAGLERLFEDQLAGFAGLERRRRANRPGEPAEVELIRATRPGADLRLAIDADLQRRAYEALANRIGSVVIMDVRQGDVLVLATRPVFDPTNLSRRDIDGQEVSFLNRATRGLYPPGSVFKVVGAMAALESGVSPQRAIVCGGSVRVAGWGRPFWCNLRTGHGPLNLAESLQRSCNVYFYEMARELGPALFRDVAVGFQFGVPTGIDLPGEARGRLPTLEALGPGELTNFSIGQGEVLVTPLQVARAYAGIANRQSFPVPRLVVAIDGQPVPVAEGARVPFSSAHLAAIEEGLARVVNEPAGTAHRARFPRHWDVVGKTSTAQNARGGIDAWFAGYWPRNHPRYAFAIMVEDSEAGGGEAVAPIMRELIRAIEEPTLAATNSPRTTAVN